MNKDYCQISVINSVLCCVLSCVVARRDVARIEFLRAVQACRVECRVELSGIHMSHLNDDTTQVGAVWRVAPSSHCCVNGHASRDLRG